MKSLLNKSKTEKKKQNKNKDKVKKLEIELVKITYINDHKKLKNALKV